jgi:hypothetical protein
MSFIELIKFDLERYTSSRRNITLFKYYLKIQYLDMFFGCVFVAFSRKVNQGNIYYVHSHTIF